jgi:hypothetical protein
MSPKRFVLICILNRVMWTNPKTGSEWDGCWLLRLHRSYELIVAQVEKKFPFFCRTLRFSTFITGAFHRPWTSCILFAAWKLTTSHLHSGVWNVYFSLCFLTGMMYEFIQCPVRATYRTHRILFLIDHPNWNTNEVYRQTQLLNVKQHSAACFGSSEPWSTVLYGMEVLCFTVHFPCVSVIVNTAVWIWLKMGTTLLRIWCRIPFTKLMSNMFSDALNPRSFFIVRRAVSQACLEL